MGCGQPTAVKPSTSAFLATPLSEELHRVLPTTAQHVIDECGSLGLLTRRHLVVECNFAESVDT